MITFDDETAEQNLKLAATMVENCLQDFGFVLDPFSLDSSFISLVYPNVSLRIVTGFTALYIFNRGKMRLPIYQDAGVKAPNKKDIEAFVTEILQERVI